MLEDLIVEIEAHLAWRAQQNRALAESTFGRLAVNDGKLLDRLRSGGTITVATMDSIRSWIAADRQPTQGAAA